MVVDGFVVWLGGDEFVVFVEGDVCWVIVLVCVIVDVVIELLIVNGYCVVFGLSIGVVIVLFDGNDLIILFKNVDFVLYCVKNDGKGMFCFFEVVMDVDV